MSTWRVCERSPCDYSHAHPIDRTSLYTFVYRQALSFELDDQSDRKAWNSLIALVYLSYWPTYEGISNCGKIQDSTISRSVSCDVAIIAKQGTRRSRLGAARRLLIVTHMALVIVNGDSKHVFVSPPSSLDTYYSQFLA